MNSFMRYIKRSKLRRYITVIFGVVLILSLIVFSGIMLNKYILNKKMQKQTAITNAKYLICENTILTDFIVTPLDEDYVVNSKTHKIYMKYDCKPITLTLHKK